MDITKFRKKLERYLKGTANETENAIIEAWYKSYQVDEAREINATERAAIKHAIGKKIDAGTKGTPKIYQLKYFRIAASLLLISGAAFIYYRSQQKANPIETYITVQTNAGQVKQLTLPDSSIMWVNSLSRVRIPLSFDGAVRTILLDEGEAFFEVKHNEVKPFRVNTTALTVQVLGTSFNVNAYKALKSTRVAVATGKVSVSAAGKLLSSLTPGQQLVFDNTAKSYLQNTINIDDSSGWKDGYTYLKQAGFNELAVVIKNLYGIELKAATPAVAKYRFTLRLKRGMPVGDALKIISTIHNTHFRKEGNKVVLY